MKYWILHHTQEMANDFEQEFWLDQVIVTFIIPHSLYLFMNGGIL